MIEERRKATRFALSEEIDANVSGTAVRVVELSRIGARVEHHERFLLETPQLRIRWRDYSAAMSMRIIRSEIVGKRDGRLLYQTGVQFTTVDASADAAIAAILHHAEASGAENPPASAPVTEPEKPAAPSASLDDSWTRHISFLKRDPEDDYPYAQFRCTPEGWVKSYVATPVQPEDGFTIPREQLDFAELQRTFEAADSDTRRMMRIALESKLAAGTT